LNIPHNKPTIGKEEIHAVSRLMEKTELTMGERVIEFEKKFSKFIGLPSAAVSSGTAALHLALIALDVGEQDEVILPSYTCASVGMPILYLKARPVFGDLGEDYNILPEEIKKRITEKTKAVIVPHMFGYPADIEKIKEICEDRGIFLIEDCAQSIGALYKNKKVGTFGDVSIFSFYSTKMITSIQGGMISSGDAGLVEDIKDIRFPDMRYFEGDKKIRYSYMMSDISAAVGIVQLAKLNSFAKKRRKIASIYRENIENVIHPEEESNKKHVFSRYVIRTKKDPEILIEKMKNEGITCERMHVPPLHVRNVFNQGDRISLKRTEKIARSALSLPIFPSLTDRDAVEISGKLNMVIRDGL